MPYHISPCSFPSAFAKNSTREGAHRQPPRGNKSHARWIFIPADKTHFNARNVRMHRLRIGVADNRPGQILEPGAHRLTLLRLREKIEVLRFAVSQLQGKSSSTRKIKWAYDFRLTLEKREQFLLRRPENLQMQIR